MEVFKNLAVVLRERRQKLANLVDFPVILWSSSSCSRNYPANVFRFRASSHFLYFAGLPLENAAIKLDGGRLELFIDEATPESSLWHGETPKRQELADLIGADAAFPLAELSSKSAGAATISVQNLTIQNQQAEILNRPIFPAKSPQGIDLKLSKAIISLRLYHDELAISELRKAAKVTVNAHKAGIKSTFSAKFESQIRAAMEAVIMAENMTTSYNSIVSVHGEVLHNETYSNPIKSGDLLLADVGAETSLGWAGDVTRTWPVSGRFSPTQRDIYDIVLAAHDACIKQMRPGVEYKDIHLLACKIIAEGLVSCGILKGNPEDLVEMDAHALFFPHGIGHLIGLDVHDMEDLGDLAGYEESRTRSPRFGLSYLRLNRCLKAGMLTSIEPGFYQVPALLKDPQNQKKYADVVNWDKLSLFADVRGIRIEDDVLVTETGVEVLTAELPSQVEQIEELVTNHHQQ
jgi:Xaa-Pro aminopeptidase